MTAKKKSTPALTANPTPKPRPEPANLVRRYGQIGIGALTAALQYSTSLSKPSRASTTPRFDERFVEHAA